MGMLKSIEMDFSFLLHLEGTSPIFSIQIYGTKEAMSVLISRSNFDAKGIGLM